MRHSSPSSAPQVPQTEHPRSKAARHRLSRLYLNVVAPDPLPWRSREDSTVPPSTQREQAESTMTEIC